MSEPEPWHRLFDHGKGLMYTGTRTQQSKDYFATTAGEWKLVVNTELIVVLQRDNQTMVYIHEDLVEDTPPW